MQKDEKKTEGDQTPADEHIRVRKIESGAVIDHLPSGSAFRVLEALGIDESFPGTVSVLINAPSSQYGLKDIIKVEGRELSKSDLEKAAIIAPYATVNVVRNFKVVEKFRVRVPDVITGIVDCPNVRCITNREGKSEFLVQARDPLKIRCRYCLKTYHYKELAGMTRREGALDKWMKS